MNFIVSSTALLSRLQSVGRVVNSKNTLPILDCFLFDVHDNKLTITGSDNETTMTTRLELVSSDANLRFCINAKTIQDSMKEIAEQPLSFNINPENMEIIANYQNGRFCIVGQSADEYPMQSTTEQDMNGICISSEKLLKGISHTIYATGDDEYRIQMNGIYFDMHEDGITFVATDGNKLVRNKLFLPATEAAFILPKKPANLLKNLLPKESGDITVKFNDRNAVFISENTELRCRLTEGRYPNYNSVIPQNNPYKTTVDRLSLLSALKRVLIFSNQSSALIKLFIENNELVVSGQDIDYSTSAEEKVQCEYNDTPFRIGFKGTFLIDILNNLNSEQVILELADPSRAGVIVPVQQEDNEDQLVLLMPMMLND